MFYGGNAPYFDGCDLLVAADCAAYTYGDFHGRFLAGRKLLIGCPKLDGVDYTEKLTAVLESNDMPITYYDITLVPTGDYADHSAFMADVLESGLTSADTIA